MYFADQNTKNTKFELICLKQIRYWHRPGRGLFEVFQKMKEKDTDDPTLLDKDYVELYIGSLFAMALQESEHIDFWIGKPLEDPPDLAVMTMSQDADKKISFRSRELEITRYTSKGKSLIETILSKDKPYPANYVIVCFLEPTGIEDFREIYNQLVGKLKNIHHVFLIFNGAKISGREEISEEEEEVIGKVTLIQISPIFDTYTIDIGECLGKWKLNKIRLIYTHNANVYYGLRPGESKYPKIIS